MKNTRKALAAALAILLLIPAVFSLQGCSGDTPPDADFMATTQEVQMFSFTYGGKASKDLLRNWDFSQSGEKQDAYTLETAKWTDPDTGLQVTAETKRFAGGAVEWVARLENTGKGNSLMIENFRIADFMLSLGEDATDEVRLTCSKGTDIRADDFVLVEKKLPIYGSKVVLSPSGGRSSSGDCMPYFNVHTESEGYILAIGWTGQWEAVFKRSADGVSVSAGMENTHFVLYPGESVRTPSFTVMPWSGSEENSYNQWRSHMLLYHTPRDTDGNAVTLPITCGAWGGDTAQAHRNTIGYIQSQGYNYDAYWVDAGWFGAESRHSSDQYGDEWFKNAGDWYHNETLYPNGLKEVSDAAHEAGMDFLLWFEPERAWCDSQIVKEHPQWFLNTGATENTSFLFNMGDPEARQWMTDFISGKIQEYGVDIYRQDFNIDPLPFWEANDAKDRQGISEMKYIEGLYQFLAGLLERNPGLILDNCAGGGRRLDYEILTYALPMFRSDYQCFTTYETTPCQVQTDGLSHWVPLSGTCVQYRPGDTYSFRSNLAYAVQFPASPELEWETDMITQFHKAQPCFTGDYYRLTEGDVTDSSQWYAYQMARDDLGEGFVLAFRRENASESTKTLAVHVPAGITEIEFTDADTGESWTQKIAAPNGGKVEITLKINNTKESKLIFYKTK